MPSRRDYLRGVAGSGLGGLAGCMGYFDRTTGTVFRKTVSVAYPTRDRGPVWTSVAILALGADGRTALAQYDPEYATVDIDAVSLSVSTEQAELMNQRFSGTKYTAGIDPGEGNRGMNRAADRAGFNELHLGGSATVGTYTADDGTGYFRVHATEPPQQNLTIREVSRFDIDERFCYTHALRVSIR